MAIVMALAYIVIFTTLMLAMLAIVIGQVRPTAQARKDIGSVNAAASGLQTALTRLRTATDVDGAGNRGQLPCVKNKLSTTFKDSTGSTSTPGAKLKGTASTLAGSFTYEVSIAYYAEDPTDKDAAWLATAAMACPLAATPNFAYLQSYGVGAEIVSGTLDRGNRSQTGVYRFSVPAVNIAGGPLPLRSSRNLCLDAGTAPMVGSTLSFQPCQDTSAAAADRARQLFVYRSDLSLFFGGNSSLNLCVQASSSQPPQLQRCVGIGTGTTFPYAPGQQVQEWSYNNNGKFAAASDNGTVDKSCIEPSTVAPGAPLMWKKTCSSGGSDSDEAFLPDAAVGAGLAGSRTDGVPGPPTGQFVNFDQFGRCLDIKSNNVEAPNPFRYTQTYPCKQSPDASVSFNQTWTFDSTGSFYVTTNNRRYCLAPEAGNPYVYVAVCNGTAAQQWTATGEAGPAPDQPGRPYNLVHRASAKCLSLSALASDGRSRIVLETCDGSRKQRWNAPAPPPTSGLNNIREGFSVNSID